MERRSGSAACLVSCALCHKMKFAALLMMLCMMMAPRLGLVAKGSVGVGGRNHQEEIMRFFEEVDTDRDGEIGSEEASKFIEVKIGGSDFDSKTEISEAAKEVLFEMDSGDEGRTVSSSELKESQNFLGPDSVANWLTYSMLLPQYATSFRKNAVTSQDFAILTNVKYDMLKEDLGVESQLHQKKLLRAMRMQLLGIGEAPGAVPQLHLTIGTDSCTTLDWTRPQHLGRPAVHGYLIQKRDNITAPWRHLDFVEDDADNVSIVDPNGGLKAQSAYYRVQSWNSFGHSEWSSVSADDPTGKKYYGLVHHITETSFMKRLSGTIGGLIIAFGFFIRFIQIPVWVVYLRKLWERLFRAGYRQRQVSAGESEPIQHSPVMSVSDDDGNHQTLSQGIGTPRIRRGSVAPGIRRASLVHSRNESFDEGVIEALEERGRQSLGPFLSLPAESMEANAGALIGDFNPMIGPPSPGLDICPRVQSGSEGKQNPEKVRQEARNRCAFPECVNRWDRFRIRDIKNAHRRHYCYCCQQFFCHVHTRIASHSNRKACDIGSRCICEICFQSMDVQKRAKMESGNHLKKSESPNSSTGSNRKGGWKEIVERKVMGIRLSRS